MPYWAEVLPGGKIYSCGHFEEGAPLRPTMGGVFHEVDRYYDPKLFGYKNGKVVPIEQVESLDEIKAKKWAEIKARRDQAEFDSFTYNGMQFDGDLDAQRRLGNYISVSKTAIAAEQPFSVDFTLADNTVVTLTAKDFLGIELAKANQIAEVFSKAAALRERINNAQSRAALDKIRWD